MRRLQRVELENRELSDRLVAAEHANGELLKLLVAVRRLAGCTTTAGVIQALRDLVTNVIGSEDHAIYLLERGDVLRWVGGSGDFGGVELHRRLGEELLGNAVASRLPYVVDASQPYAIDAWRQEPPLAASIPLVFGNRLLGAIAVFRVLPQREPLTMESDGDVLAIIGEQGANALVLAELHENVLSPAEAR